MGAVYSSCENCFGEKPDAKESRKLEKSQTTKKYQYNELKADQFESTEHKSATSPFKTMRSLNTSSKIKHGRQRSGKTFVKEDVDPNKKVTIKDFDFVKVIGRGAYGKVFLVQKKSTRQFYALKTLKKQHLVKGGYAEQAMVERNIMQNASHPFVMKLHFSFQNENSLYYIMDFCQGGELFTQLQNKGSFDEETARFYTAELVLGLQYLHESLNVIYRDLKPKNILLDGSGHIKITDFGLSKVGKKAYTICGTAEYVAPEVLAGNGYDKTVDYWSLGCFVYEMLFGSPPFLMSDKARQEQDILHADPLMPHTFSETAKDFVLKLLAKDPTQRLGYNGAEEVKGHAFFNSVNWDEIITLKKQPPIIPLLTKSTDLRHFAKVIVDEPAVETPTAKVQVGSKNPFTDFTYVKRDLTDKNFHKPKMLVFDN